MRALSLFHRNKFYFLSKQTHSISQSGAEPPEPKIERKKNLLPYKLGKATFEKYIYVHSLIFLESFYVVGFANVDEKNKNKKV